MPKKIVGFLSACICPYAADATILSSSGNTPSAIQSACLQADSIDSCRSCFFASTSTGNYNFSSFRHSQTITFDTDFNECRTADGTQYFYNYDDCFTNVAGDDEIACSSCMLGEVATIDGDGVGIRFEIASNGNYYCYIETEQYVRCADAYYGFPWDNDNDTLQGCSKCPMPGIKTSGTYGRESFITDCYIAANTAQKDTTGTYVYTSDCHYKN